MSRSKLVLVLTSFLALSLQPARTGAQQTAKGPSLIETLKALEVKQDDLGIRLAIKRFSRHVPTYGEWIQVRQLLHRRPNVGYSLMFKWDSMPFRGAPKDGKDQLQEAKVNTLLRAADEAMSRGKFQTSFGYYQNVARQLKREILAGRSENRLLYQITIHSMARALYGAGRFEESLRVYSWISKNYPRYRQVLFERMWTGFRAGRMEIALGAIASQQSAYFANYMEPESYLVQLYIYKKLCRTDEQATLRQSIERFRDSLANGRYTYAEWAKSDLETFSLLRLTEQPIDRSLSAAGQQERRKEQADIKRFLLQRFEIEKKRLLRELTQVLAYFNLAVAADTLKMSSSELSRKTLRTGSQQEFWPVDDAEDWLDELGSHIFIGQSECQSKKE